MLHANQSAPVRTNMTQLAQNITEDNLWINTEVQVSMQFIPQAQGGVRSIETKPIGM